MSGEAHSRKFHRLLVRWLIFGLGLIIMSFGIVMMIKADFGSAPWDVFHIGLYLKFGLSIGMWSIIAGIVVITISSMITKSWPQLGALINMLLVGVFIDFFMYVFSWLNPTFWVIKLLLLLAGILICGYGIGLYIAPKCGAGPRDSLMLALTQLTGWKVQYVRGGIEVVVLIAGWLLGGPVFLGTILFTFGIGTVVGYTLPQCQYSVDKLLSKIDRSNDKDGGVLTPVISEKVNV
ncbi:YitT family protein [Bacillus horti]